MMRRVFDAARKLASDAKQCDVAISSREKLCVSIVLAQPKLKT
jgi:hypothetical protein